MNLARTVELARQGRLYPAVILHGGSAAERAAAAGRLARVLLCAAAPAVRPCGECAHCRRLRWPETEVESSFHPDFHLLARDLKTSTSAEATRQLLRQAQLSPFEARGQVFVVTQAESLTPEAGDALLKAIEEPGTRAPRHFLLVAPSRLDLPATLRSRSFALFLGPAEAIAEAEVGPLAAELAVALAARERGGGGLALLASAAALARAGGWEEARATRPFHLAAAVAARAARDGALGPQLRRALLELAGELLVAAPWRLRGIPAERLLEGLVARHLAPVRPAADQ